MGKSSTQTATNVTNDLDSKTTAVILGSTTNNVRVNGLTNTRTMQIGGDTMPTNTNTYDVYGSIYDHATSPQSTYDETAPIKLSTIPAKTDYTSINPTTPKPTPVDS